MQKTLNGWTRIFIVLSIVYAIFVALMSFSFLTTRDDIKNDWLESVVDFTAKRITADQEHRFYLYKNRVRESLLGLHHGVDGVIKAALATANQNPRIGFITLLFDEEALLQMLEKADSEGDIEIARNLAVSIRIGRENKIEGFYPVKQKKLIDLDLSGTPPQEPKLWFSNGNIEGLSATANQGSLKLSDLQFREMNDQKELVLSNYKFTLLKEIVMLFAIWAIPLFLIALLFSAAKWVYRGFAATQSTK